MRPSLPALACLASIALAQQSMWGQCGGIGWTGYTSCLPPAACTTDTLGCKTFNPYYAQCTTGVSGPTSSASSVLSSSLSMTSPRPVSSTSSTSSTPSSSVSTSRAHTTTAVGTPTTSQSATTVSGSYKQTSTGKTKYAGINIAGFDFGCSTDGECQPQNAYPPVAALGGPDGIGQMKHFVNDDELNIFRLPVGWQYLVNSTLGGSLNPTYSANYDLLVQGCLSTGSHCIIDIHNYARWNGESNIIGQGGPTNAQFASLWSQLAAKYANQSQVIFGIMNEPHDLVSVETWAETVQYVVTAIRAAGATSQMILLPGNDWTGASSFVSDGSGPDLLNVTNPDGSTNNLIFDVHKYLDADNSGTGDCVTNNIANALAPLATWLRSNSRQALLTETGGFNDAACESLLCQEFAFMNDNADVYLGYLGWAAGSFTTAVSLSEVPTYNSNNGTWTDQPLVSACFAR